MRLCPKFHKQDCAQEGQHAGQAEEESAAAGGIIADAKQTRAEQIALFLVFLDNAAAVGKPETESFLVALSLSKGRWIVNAIVVQCFQIILAQSHTRVTDIHLYIVVAFSGCYCHTAALGRELAGIVGKRVYHEKRQRLIRFHLQGGGLHVKPYALLFEGIAALSHYLEQVLQVNGPNVERQLSLAHLYPFGQHIVELADLRHELQYVVAPLGTHTTLAFHAHHLAGNAVEIGNDGMHKRHACAAHHVLLFAFLQFQLRDVELFLQFFELLVQQSHGLGFLPARLDVLQLSGE